jgi:hypothetical protein
MKVRTYQRHPARGGAVHQPGSKAVLRASRRGLFLGMAGKPRTVPGREEPEGLGADVMRGRPSRYSMIGPSSGLKATRPSDKNCAKSSADSGSEKNWSGGVWWFMVCAKSHLDRM